MEILFMNKEFFKGFAAFYLLTGLLQAFAMKAALPALNWIGMVYIASMWPLMQLSVIADRDLYPISHMYFTF
jgi:hypothetical protein